ncbi:MAG TPA: hypothetical protein VNZ25_05520 [Candidatus Angelobacter sp.]|jgi:hypothetical protein|nr:hypothetical protein [Candidatus Angelobacter sp.]
MKCLYLFLLAVNAVCFCGGCCANKNEEDKATALGISPEVNEEMMRDSPLYKYIMTQEHGYKIDTQQFLERVKAKHESSELQAWALTVLNAHTEDKKPFNLPRKEIPEFILELDPPIEPFVTVHPNSYIAVVWGGGFGFWGLFLAKSDSGLPENKSIYFIEWSPGVQAFHDIQ